MSDRPLLMTTTGEPFQPACLHYTADHKRLAACFRKLRCIDFDETQVRWTWLYDDEARSLQFEQSWKVVSKHGPIVIGAFYFRGAGTVELYVRSIERALIAVTFFDRHIPRKVARFTHIDVANRLYSAVEREITPETVFASAQADLRQQQAKLDQLLADPAKVFAGIERTQLPELERFPAYFYEDGIEVLTTKVQLRQRLAMEHWLGNTKLTISDLIKEAVGWQTIDEAPPFPAAETSARINWNFGPETPVTQFFSSDLSDPAYLAEAVDSFIDALERDEFRTWEAVIREEQGLITMPIHSDKVEQLISFNEPGKDESVHYINEIPRYNEPWYEILRQLAPRLLIGRFRTADIQYDEQLVGWSRIAYLLEQQARGLSLPEGVRRPLDVVPAELRHQLWLQTCFDPLSGLGQSPELTLADQEEHWRIDAFLRLLHEHRESVAFLGLTLAGLLERCELPDADRSLFIQLVSDELGLSGVDDLLAPKLSRAAVSPDPPSEPIERLAEEEIRQLILHLEPLIHRAAMGYFAGAESRDPGIAPLVIQSLQAMDNDCDQVFACGCLAQLAQTKETSAQLIGELKAPRWYSGEEMEIYRLAVATSLLAADPAFLASRKRTLLTALPSLDPDRYADFRARMSEKPLNNNERWTTFVHLVDAGELVERTEDCYYPSPGFVDRVEGLIGGMGSDERPIRWVRETLSRTINDLNYDSGRELIAVSLSGVLRLKEAIPYLVALLHDDDDEIVGQVVRSLTRIGGDAVIESLDRTFRRAGQHFRIHAAAVLQHIHTDSSVRVLQNWLQWNTVDAVRGRVFQALLGQFVTSEIDPARRWLIDVNPNVDDVSGLRRTLAAISLATGRDYTELDDWVAAAREGLAPESFTDDDMDDDVSWIADEPCDEDEDDCDDDLDNCGDPFSLSRLGPRADNAHSHGDWNAATETGPAPVINRGPKVGRNDPCPCGSGKKFKKCCLKK